MPGHTPGHISLYYEEEERYYLVRYTAEYRSRLVTYHYQPVFKLISLLVHRGVYFYNVIIRYPSFISRAMLM